jgi:hypothetical protein
VECHGKGISEKAAKHIAECLIEAAYMAKKIGITAAGVSLVYNKLNHKKNDNENKKDEFKKEPNYTETEDC